MAKQTTNKVRRRNLPRIVAELCILSLLVYAGGCQDRQAGEQRKKELLFYCGITMVQPMQEIARLIEQRHDCIIKITQGGSGNLYRSIKANNMGDLYLPGSESYIKTAQQDGFVTETILVGRNQAAFFVRKGNPLGITADLSELADSRYSVVLGAEDTGSIGRETARILRRNHLYESAMKNSIYLTTDSKDLIKALVEGEADLAVNWYAVGLRPENIPLIDSLRLSDDVAPPHRLVLGLLKFSAEPDLARRVMDLASSTEGQKILKAYGF